MAARPPLLAAAVGVVVTGVLALTEQYDAVPAALVATLGSYWALREDGVPTLEDDEIHLPPDDLL